MRIAILFYGAIRNIEYVIESIQTNLIQGLGRNGSVHIYAHTFAIHNITNARSNEKQLRVDAQDVFKVHPIRYEIAEQRLVDRRFSQWKGHYNSSGFANSDMNVFRALFSKHRVFQLMESHEQELGWRHDVVALARLDVRYITPVAVPTDLLHHPEDVFVPDFHQWGGVNDRFAIGGHDAIQAVASTFEDVERRRGLTAGSEKTLCSTLRRRGVHARAFPMRLVRVRANGVIAALDVRSPRIEAVKCE